MTISNFFLDLRSAYQAELDDLSFDSEGLNVLQRRLNEKRGELDFLLQIMDLNPEMVAVVLHQAFRFNAPDLMRHFLTLNDDELLSWDSLQENIHIERWAEPIVARILNEPLGEWFMSVACALEFMHWHPLVSDVKAQLTAQDEDAEDSLNASRELEHSEPSLDDDERQAQEREEAANDWLAEQGFDRKD